MSKLTIEFPDKKTKDQFASWLSRQGEQGFMNELDIIGGHDLHFGYHGVENEQYPRTDKRRYGKFLVDNTVRVTIVEL